MLHRQTHWYSRRVVWCDLDKWVSIVTLYWPTVSKMLLMMLYHHRANLHKWTSSVKEMLHHSIIIVYHVLTDEMLLLYKTWGTCKRQKSCRKKAWFPMGQTEQLLIKQLNRADCMYLTYVGWHSTLSSAKYQYYSWRQPIAGHREGQRVVLMLRQYSSTLLTSNILFSLAINCKILLHFRS